MNLKILTVVGARPQFVKAAMVSRAIITHNEAHPQATITEEILHTGQHYDESMSRIFFEQLRIPVPAVNLRVGSGTHGTTTGKMLEGIEKEIINRKPDWVLVYGDTNSTLAGALAAAKLHVPIAHVEAGLRSYNRRMPEEINRLLTDHVSSLLLCPTHAAVANLAKEGITRGVHHVGDVMYDAAIVFGEIAGRESTILSRLGLAPKKYLLATVHRAENTDEPDRLKSILGAFSRMPLPVIFPVHPRTRAKISEIGLKEPEFLNEMSRKFPPGTVRSSQSVVAAVNVGSSEFEVAPSTSYDSSLRLIPPVSFLDMVFLEKHAQCVLTDSGGVQKEAYFHCVPCITLRDETEWVETEKAGWNQVVGADADKILSAFQNARCGAPITDYGQGNCAANILEILRAAFIRQ